MKNQRKHMLVLPVNTSQEPLCLLSPRILGHTSSGIHELKALLMSNEYPKQNLPGEAIKSIIQRFVLMPCIGWYVFKEVSVKKLKENVLIDELKKRAEPFITSQAGTKCSMKRFATESSKHTRGIDSTIEENTLHRAKMIIRAKEISRKELASIKFLKVTEVPKTRKVLSESLDQELLEIIDQ